MKSNDSCERRRGRSFIFLSSLFISVGIVLFRRRLFDTFLQFFNDLVVIGGVHLVRVLVQDMEDLVAVARRFNLDFDDAYQYAVAEKYDLEIISFDSDFDRTEKGRKTPDQLG